MGLQKINWTQIDSMNVPTGYTVDIGKVNGPIRAIYAENLNLSGVTILDYLINSGSFSGNTLTLTNNVGTPVIITGFTSTTITGFTYNDNNLTLYDSEGNIFNVVIDTMTGLTVNGVINSTIFSGGTYYGDGSQLTGISTTDYYVTGITFNESTYELTLYRNDGQQLSQSFSILASDLFVTGGTYNPTTGVATFTNNSGNTFNVSGFITGFTDIIVTAFTYNNNVLTISSSDGNVLSTTIDSMTGLTINGNFTVTGDTTLNSVTATTITATTYSGLPESTISTLNTPSIAIFGDGSTSNPIYADLLIAPVNNGIVSGGEVSWISGYTYSVSPAVYYINSQLYTSPYTEIMLSTADTTFNRIDVFVLTTSGTAEVITGTPSTNPEQPSINTATQIQTSFALVIANTTSPVVGRELIYFENVEWTGSTTGNFNAASLNNPYSGLTVIEGTTLSDGHSVLLSRSSLFQPLINNTVLIFYIRSKASWNNGRSLQFSFRNGLTTVGLTVSLSNSNSYGFVSSNTTTYQRIVIPLSDFGLTPSDNVNRLFIRATGGGGTFGMYLDNIELQGTNPTPTVIGTTDNVGVFYVNKNFSGTAGAIVTGYTIGSIISTNSGYNTQLTAARMGDMNKAYPCPWSARNAAMQAMTAGTITKAFISVIGGSQYIVGSDVSSNNGPITGGTTTATIADIGFSSANRTNIASLMKHNIFYHFEENSGLRHINRTYAINSGCYNVDATDTTFVSGIFGKGTFHHVYGNGDGTFSNFSQRFIEIDNTRCSVYFECDEAALQRASLFIFSHKKLDVKARNWFCDSESFALAIQGSTDLNEGDGLPMSITLDILNFYKGNEYYPYPLTTNNTSLSRPMFALDVINATRQKSVIAKIKNLFVSGVDLQDIYTSFLGGINRDCRNYLFHLEVDNLYQKTDTVKQAFLIATSPLITIGGGTGNWVRENFHETFIIKNADINASLFRFGTITHANVLNKNNSITIKLGTVIRRGANTVSPNYIIGLPIPPSAAGVANSVVGERPVIKIEADYVVAQSGRVFSDVYTLGVGTYIGATTISGTFITKDGSPVIEMNGTGNACILKDAILIAKGSATQAIQVNNGGNPVSIYTNDTIINLPIESGITQYGFIHVDDQIQNFY